MYVYTLRELHKNRMYRKSGFSISSQNIFIIRMEIFHAYFLNNVRMWKLKWRTLWLLKMLRKHCMLYCTTVEVLQCERVG